MSKLQKWLLMRIAREVVIQGYDHRRRIINFYKILVDAARCEFREDDKVSLDCFLRKCHEEALGQKDPVDKWLETR